jgi:RNA polymerase sigma-70 factor (ECF subfamily)
MTDNESMLSRLRNGQPDAAAWLVDQFENSLFRFFVCSHRDYHLAQEQTAETFAQLIRSLPAMKGDQSQLRSFVFSIARHVQLRHWRRQKMPCSDAESAEAVPDPRPSPDDELANRDEINRVLKVISQFDSPIREILLLRFVEDHSIEEIAVELALPHGTVKSHIHRGILRLRASLVPAE